MAYVVALFTVGVVGLLLIFVVGTPERERTGVVFLTAIGAIDVTAHKARQEQLAPHHWGIK